MSDTPLPQKTAEVHAAYRRLLQRPEVQRLAAHFRLDRSVRYEFVGPRRSFHGLAVTTQHQQTVRLPGNPRPEPYLLLTLLHEWAHLLVHRGGPLRALTAGKQPPHGKRWREQYERIVREAVRAGLFPGNEEEVLRHCAAGEGRTYRARLRDTDGELLAPTTEPPPAQFAKGDTVCFSDRHGRVVTGTVSRINRLSYTVIAGTSTFRVPIGYASLARADAVLPETETPAPMWRPGMRVQFTEEAGKRLHGVIVRVNRKTLTVDASDGLRYRVGYAHPELRPR